MVDKIKIDIECDNPITAQQAMNIATDVTTKFCFAWIDLMGYEYNPEDRHYSEADLIVLIIAPNNQWEFYFVDSFKQFKTGAECGV